MAEGMLMRAHGLVAVLAVAALAVAGCTAQRDSASAKGTPAQSWTAPVPSTGAPVTVAGLTANYHGSRDISGGAQGAQNVTIEMKDSYFDPTVLHGAPGQKVAFTLRNTGKTAHTFTTADGLADIAVQPGAIAEGRVTLPEHGNVSFFCRFHKAHGMAGGFNVSGNIDSSGQGPTPTSKPT
jgi:plastocyanin